MLYKMKYISVALLKRKAEEGPSRSPKKKKKVEKEKLKAPTLLPQSLIVEVEAMWASRATAW